MRRAGTRRRITKEMWRKRDRGERSELGSEAGQDGPTGCETFHSGRGCTRGGSERNRRIARGNVSDVGRRGVSPSGGM